jgi:hypothetical protein
MEWLGMVADRVRWLAWSCWVWLTIGKVAGMD